MTGRKHDDSSSISTEDVESHLRVLSVDGPDTDDDVEGHVQPRNDPQLRTHTRTRADVGS